MKKHLVVTILFMWRFGIKKNTTEVNGITNRLHNFLQGLYHYYQLYTNMNFPLSSDSPTIPRHALWVNWRL